LSRKAPSPRWRGASISASTSFCCSVSTGSGTNGISSLEQQANQNLITAEEKGAQITELLSGVQHGQSLGLLLVMTVLPFVLMLASYLLYQKRYKLDEEEYARICAEIEAGKKG